MEETGKNVLLNGFELEPAERAIVDNIIKSRINKIRERADFDYIKLRLRKSPRGKNYLYEIEASLKAKKEIFNAKITDFNLFSALAEVMEKLLSEMIHKIRTARQRKI